MQTVLDQVAAASPWTWETKHTVRGDANHGYGKGFEIDMLLDLVAPHPATAEDLKGLILAPIDRWPVTPNSAAISATV